MVINFVFKGGTKKAVNRSGIVPVKVLVNSDHRIFSQISKKSIRERDKEAVTEVINSNISPPKTYYFRVKTVFSQTIVVKSIIITLEDGWLFLEVTTIKENLDKRKDGSI